jgi:hypothetical protein
LEAACGWRRYDYHDQNGGEHTDWGPQGERLGWIDGNNLFLLPAVAYACAERLCREQGRSLSLTDRMLGRRLKEAGWIISTDRRDRGESKTVRVHEQPGDDSKVRAGYHLNALLFLGMSQQEIPF